MPGQVPRGRIAALAALAACAAAWVPLPALAQGAADGGKAAPKSKPKAKAKGKASEPVKEPVIEPPALDEFVEAVYPPEALAAGIEASVVLQIDLDAEGLVTGVTVVEPAGQGFDEAAVDAAWQFTFLPMKVDGVPAESQILYSYRFFVKKKVVEAPPVEAPGDGGVGAGDGGSAAGEVGGGAGADDGVTGDGQAGGAGVGEVDEADEYFTVVKGEKQEVEEVVKHTLDTKEILMMPGTGGDLLKSVQNLPGMARAPANTGLLIIRGSAPGDSLILMDDHPIPLAYHFGALSSVVNSEFIEEIEFIPGNFGVKYGRGTGGVINVKPKWEIPDKWHLVADLDLIDASIWSWGPLGTKGYLGMSIRRSYIDAIMEAGGKAISKAIDLNMTVAPVYWDYQLFAMVRPTGDESDEIRITFAGDNDRFRFLFTDPGDDPSINGVGFSNGFHVGQISWSHEFQSVAKYAASVEIGWIGAEGNVGTNVKFGVDNLLISHRQELTLDLGQYVDMSVGIDLMPNLFKAKALAPALGFEADVLAGSDLSELDVEAWLVDFAAFAELRLKVLDSVAVIPGVRVDWHDTTSSWEPQPRIVARWTPFANTTLSAGIGVFTKTPSIVMEMEGWGNPDLLAERAVHYSIGWEQVIPQAWLDVSLTLFYKTLDRLAEQTDAYVVKDGELVPLRFDNTGGGRAYGLELLVKIQPDHFVYGWLAYTLSKSERWSPDANGWIPFDFDQPHLLTLLIGFDLGKGWNVSARFRVASGNPSSPVVGTIFDADHDTYIGIYSDRPSERLPTYHSLDIRIDKKWNLKVGGWISLYLDVWNVYYAKNPEFVAYNYDYSEHRYVTGLPIIPTIGLQGGF